jgi:hypothetical protein
MNAFLPALTVKQGDRYPTYWTVPLNLTGASVRLIARKRLGPPVVLSTTITDPTSGQVEHVLDGTLTVGNYRVELEITRGAEIITAPTSTYENLRVIADLD